MKKFLAEVLLFTVFCFIFFALLNVAYFGVLIVTDWGFKKRFESINFEDPNFRILALGASTVLDGIDTELLTNDYGLKSYNLALGGSTNKTNYLQLGEYLSNYTNKPKYVLMGFNSSIEFFDDDDIHPIVEFTMKDYKYTIRDTPILKFKWLGFEFLKKVISSKHRNARLSYGQLKFQKAMPDNTPTSDDSLDIDLFESSFWVGEIARYCEMHAIQLIIIELPGNKESQNISLFGPYTIQFNNGSKATLFNFGNREFCNIFDSDTDWIGNSHLNEAGAEKFTKEMIRIIGLN